MKRLRESKHRLAVALLLSVMLVFTVGGIAGVTLALPDDGDGNLAAQEQMDGQEGAPADPDAVSPDEEEGQPAEEGDASQDEGKSIMEEDGDGSGEGEGEPAELEEPVVDMTDAEAISEDCDFLVKSESTISSYSFEDGLLVISGGRVAVKNKPGVEYTTQHIEVRGDTTLILDGVKIETVQGVLNSPIRIAQNANCKLVLNAGSYNEVAGTSLAHDGYKTSGVAGIEVSIDENQGVASNMATLTITGKGTLKATGGTNAAGIGGSKALSSKAAHGNIIINGGNIEAIGGNGGAGIGTASNMNSQLSNGSYKSSFIWGTITINGGNIKATGTPGSSAGIGGGNHVDSGNIIINGGVIEAEGYSGIGSGLGSSKSASEADKGPGHYFATVTINGGDITARGSDIGAGIGGAMYCDAIVNINGGTVKAYAGSARNKATHGGAGIGGGYQGHAKVTITGGEVWAYAGDGSGAAGIGSGTAANSHSAHAAKKDGRSEASLLDITSVTITGGEVHAYGGGLGGAGIGTGVGSDAANVSITGGTVYAYGGKSTEAAKAGGAGIGTAYAGKDFSKFDENGEVPGDKYFVLGTTNIEITDGTVLAVGGWGASGIGSGAQNVFAKTISLNAKAPDNPDGADIQAYADGTKFAIDTRQLNEDGTTTSYKEGRTINGYILQGTFVHEGEIGDYEQNPEGLKSIMISNDETQDPMASENRGKELTLMPDKYRSYATNVDCAGNYTVYTDEETIGHGEGRFFSVCSKDVYAEENVSANNVQYQVKKNDLADNFYLFPVKSVVVKKTVKSSTEDTSVLSTINGTVYFGLQMKEGPERGEFLKNNDGEIWLESIEIKNGTPQGKAYFINVPDKTFDVWEVDKNGQKVDPDAHEYVFGDAVLIKVRTNHQGEGTNNALIDDEHWSDQVEVINTFRTSLKNFQLTLKKKLQSNFKAEESANTTVVFRVAVKNADAEKPLYENYFSFIFNKAGEQSMTVTLPESAGADELIIEEVYGAGHKVKGDNRRVVDLKTADRTKPIEIEYVNTPDGDKTFKQGINNSYSQKQYVKPGAATPSDEQ